MSADEDTELRDLVAQTLEANGVLGKIRAQLRASVFLALEEQESIQNKTPFLNAELQKLLSTEEGCRAVLLIKEFLQFFKLDYTLAVFEPELSCSSEKLEYSRSVLSRQLGLAETSETAKVPLLASVVQQCKSDEFDNGRRTSLIENGFEARVTEKNGVNVVQTAAAWPAGSSKSKADAKDTSAGRKNSTGSDVDSDSFFDDRFFEKKSKPQDKKEDQKLSGPAAGKASATSLSSLADLPSLNNGRSTAVSKKAELKEKSEIIDLEDEDDKYEDDFQGSNISPLGQTPRSARSDKNVRSIENDEIDEEIEEDLSVADDLLKSDRSFNDDLTTDRTMSPAEQSAAGDYVENVLHP